MVEVDVKITAGDLYDYMLYHTYNGSSGIVGTCFGALLVVAAALRGSWALLGAGLVVMAYLPVSLFLKSRKQALLNPSFQKPLHYMLDEEGLTVSQGEQEQKLPWDSMVKAVSTSRSIILYTSRVNATLFPARELGDQRTAVVELISTHMPPGKVKIRS